MLGLAAYDSDEDISDDTESKHKQQQALITASAAVALPDRAPIAPVSKPTATLPDAASLFATSVDSRLLLRLIP